LVLDSSAVITFFENQPGSARVTEFLQDAQQDKSKLLMSVVNWGEVYYSVWIANGTGVARHVIEQMGRLPIAIVSADEAQTRLAAELKAEQKLPYADCFAASLALIRRATLVTADSDFSKLKRKVSLLLL
jgi:predicted nucleic acid-binding protein